MNEIPSKDINTDMVPPDARKHYDEWSRTGDDSSLTKLLACMFASLDVHTFEAAYAQKGDETSLKADMCIDSLTLAELLFYAEDLLAIRISNEDVLKILTVGNLKTFLSAHRQPCIDKKCTAQ